MVFGKMLSLHPIDYLIHTFENDQSCVIIFFTTMKDYLVCAFQLVLY